jgi:surface protein
MFEEAISFNETLNFDTSNVTDMSHMFADASEFNRVLNFDFSSVTTVECMFEYAMSYTQPHTFTLPPAANTDRLYGNTAVKFP